MPSTVGLRAALVVPLVAALAGCGGSGGGDAAAATPPPAGSGWVAGSFLPAASFAGRCVAPRSGTNPATGQPYADVQGTAVDENHWLRSWSNDLYLWYDEIVDRDPGLYTTPAYFDLLKTNAVTASGRSKDQFHFTYSTPEWLALVQSGTQAGYGVEWAVLASTPPRQIVVAYTNPASPAAAASLERGEVVLAVDGVDVVNANTQTAVDTLVEGLYPETLGVTHTITLRNPRTLTERTVSLQSATVTTTPVQNVSTVSTGTGTVGYLQFNDHLATAEQQLVNAVETLQAANVTDLVLDVRYNGGGLLAIASQLAYMIAGVVPTAGQTFENLTFNAKHRSINPVTGQALTPMPFLSTTLGFSTTQGQPLPTLDLPRVFVLTGPTTCSASESVINGLRGVGVQVIQIGSSTCGKPYGYYPADNCGTTYFSIQFKGVNAAGFGDYSDGFTPSNALGLGGERLPGCSVRDDFDHALGDPTEGRFAAALAYRQTASCPAPTGVSAPGFSKPAGVDAEGDGLVMKPPSLMNRILDARP
jgi:C-terminal processing protease CtpA/Prc